MKNKKIIRNVHALILLPLITIGGGAEINNPAALSDNNAKAPQVVFAPKDNFGFRVQIAIGEKQDKEAEMLKLKAEAIDQYFKDRGMPLEGMGTKMVLEAEKNGLDWRLIAAIAVRESTGGKFECKKADFNAFGWGSCKIHFKSNDHAIETVAMNLGGNNPKTARHYADKTTVQILRAYNPPSIVPRYAEQVISIMNTISPELINLDQKTLASNT